MEHQTPSLDREIEAIREAYAALNRNDLAGFAQIFDPRIERIEPEGFPSSGTYHGIETVMSQWAEARSTWAEGGCYPERFVTSGDKIVVSVHVRVRLKDHEDWIDAHIGDGFTFRDGKAIQFRTFVDEQQALEWAGAA